MKSFTASLQALLLGSTIHVSSALCPHTGLEIPPGAEHESHASWVARRRLEEEDSIPPPPEPTAEYIEALNALDIDAVKADLKAVLTDSQDWWPADYGNYGPLLIRLAWHCSGTFRNTDNRGGCSGGRQRFDPERSWEDNTNLDKARRLLGPIKEKYGIGLSWGDLFVAAGTTAIEEMGGPTLGLCFGRVDEEDGSRSIGLDECPAGEENGNCTAPMGATTMELIYVNPEGPFAQPIPDQSAVQIRDTFNRMGMNDTETVALIGGGHAFGKTHGPCNSDHAAGDSPKVVLEAGLDPDTEAWQGKCGTGVGADAWTSGFEGPWTFNPIQWDNSYFTILNSNEWTNVTGPGGKTQWHSSSDPDLVGMAAFGDEPQKIMMLTSDVALLQDPENQYQSIVKEFAENPDALDAAFAAAWHKLTTSNFGSGTTPVCTGALPVDRSDTSVSSSGATTSDDTTADDGPAEDDVAAEIDDEVVDTSVESESDGSGASGMLFSGTFTCLIAGLVTLQI